MTRINCIPVNELHAKHLVAEYRELPRVFKLAEAAYARGDNKVTPEYTLGAGHVKFFYNKLGYLENRFYQLVGEMLKRGYNPQYKDIPEINVSDDWRLDWTPTEEAMQINGKRISERLSGMEVKD